jgi:hypothetical protein
VEEWASFSISFLGTLGRLLRNGPCVLELGEIWGGSKTVSEVILSECSVNVPWG